MWIQDSKPLTEKECDLVNHYFSSQISTSILGAEKASKERQRAELKDFARTGNWRPQTVQVLPSQYDSLKFRPRRPRRSRNTRRPKTAGRNADRNIEKRRTPWKQHKDLWSEKVVVEADKKVEAYKAERMKREWRNKIKTTSKTPKRIASPYLSSPYAPEYPESKLSAAGASTNLVLGVDSIELRG